MSAALHLAGPEALDRLLPMVAARHDETGLASEETQRRDALRPLLEGSPLGAVWIVGPRSSPIGYVIVSFGWSVAAGGLVATLDDIFVRRGVRGRNVGPEVLLGLLTRLEDAGTRRVDLTLPEEAEGLRRMFGRAGFRPLEQAGHMVRSVAH